MKLLNGTKRTVLRVRRKFGLLFGCARVAAHDVYPAATAVINDALTLASGYI